MNIKQLRALVNALPDEVTSVQFGQIELEMEDLLAQQRRSDEEELSTALARVAELQRKLSDRSIAHSQHIAAASTVSPTRRERGDTDADAGISYDEPEDNAQSFRAELSALRDRNVARRRNREH